MNGMNERRSETNRSDATVIAAMNENSRLQIESPEAMIMIGINTTKKSKTEDQRQ